MLRSGPDAAGTPHDRLLAVDPDTYAETALHTYGSADATRDLQSATVTQDTVVGLTSGSGVGAPGPLLLLRDDTVTELPWPDPPDFSVRWSERTGEGYVEPGTYGVRLAWRLEDGTIGPASGPLLSTTPDPGSPDNGFEATITVEGYPTGSPSPAWEGRIAGLTVIVHPESFAGDATSVEALDVPGFRVTGWEGVPSASDDLTWSDSLEGIVSGEPHDTTTLVHHEISAGALYSYNKRLVLGDVAYDFETPLLRHMVIGGGGGTDYHLTMRVRIETKAGVITRYADPIGFDSANVGTVELRGGLLYYRDARALSWAWLVSSDYDSNPFDGATWEKVEIPDTPSEMSAAGSSNFAYVEVDQRYVDLLTRAKTTNDVTTNGNWTDQLYSVQEEEDTPTTDQVIADDTPHDATLDVTGNNIIAASEQITKARFELAVEVIEDATGNASADGSITLTVSVLDGGGSTIDDSTNTIEPPVDTTYWVELKTFQPSNAEQLRVETSASASADASGSGSAHAKGRVEAQTVQIDVADSSGGQTVSTNRSSTSAERDRDPNRIVWSEPSRPLDLRAGAVTTVGEHDDDPVLAFASNAKPVSSGQYGDYPIVVLCHNTMWAVQVGTDPFVQQVSPLSADLGATGRQAHVNVGGTLFVATQEGIARLTPAVEGIVSDPLHDDGTFLSQLDGDARLAHVRDRSQGRNEVWVRGRKKTYVFSLPAGAWSTLRRRRQAWQPVTEKTHGLGPDGQLFLETMGRAIGEVYVETAPTGLGAEATLKRLRDAWLRLSEPSGHKRLALVPSLQSAGTQGPSAVLAYQAPATRAELFHVRSHDRSAVAGLDYTNDVTSALRLCRGLAQYVSLFLRLEAPTTTTVMGAGVRFEARRPARPLAAIEIQEHPLGVGTDQGDLDSDVSW